MALLELQTKTHWCSQGKNNFRQKQSQTTCVAFEENGFVCARPCDIYNKIEQKCVASLLSEITHARAQKN